MSLAKAEVVEVFKKLQSKRENKICFDCSSKNPTWCTLTFGVYLCLDCSSVHRNMGVHISFVRSTVLDSFTLDQLRIMKVGGNGTASEYFKQYGGSMGKEAKSKYTSKAALMYKEKLVKLVEEDVKRHPEGIVFEGQDVWETNSNSIQNPQDDFFSDWDLNAPKQTIYAPSPPTQTPQPIPTTISTNVHSHNHHTTAEVVTIDAETAKAASLSPTQTSADLPDLINQKTRSSTNTSSILKPNKKGLGAKKASKGISFEEAERLAKEEESRRIKAEEEENKRATAAALRMTTEILNKSNNLNSYNNNYTGSGSSSHGQVDRVTAGVTRLGFGFDASSAPTPNPNPKSVASTTTRPGGFGSIPSSNNQDASGEAKQRFGNAKGISSDQYFGRGMFDEAQNREAREKLVNFQGRSGFGSAEYYGRSEVPEEEEQGRSFTARRDSSDLFNTLGDTAKQFAATFIDQASEDVSSLKRIVSDGSSKLGDILSDIKNRYG